MNTIKKLSILGGAAVGGVVGGSLSMIGKLSGVKIIDDIGSSIVSSTIYTGSIAGDLLSGAVDTTVGKLKKDDERLNSGVSDLKSGGKKVVGNFLGNFNLVATNGREMVSGALRRDKVRVVKSARNLAKIATIGMLTVGAIKLDSEEDENK